MFGSSGYILPPVSCDYHECHMGHMAGNRSLDTTQNNVKMIRAFSCRWSTGGGERGRGRRGEGG